ncbi:MAG: ATP-binding cassette domain-containing protein, partial [Betaproteobacteria bacterium]|nr:ATP-binding cassette domain-containing protein [Betaproteobacteria bacterium]
MSTEPLLRIESLWAGYEPGLSIVRGASLAVTDGEVLAILGPNGAGKSTLVKAVAGLVPVTDGRVWLAGREITHEPAHAMTGLGL